MWTEEEIQFLKENYKKEGSAFCCQKLNKTKNQVKHRVEYLKLTKPRFDHSLDHIGFVRMDTPESVYIAGFLFADGHCRKKSTQISLHISKSDMDQIYPILCKFGPWNLSSYKSNGGKSSYVHTCNKEIYNFFCNMDYKEKSIREPTKILASIEKDLHFYFWRGFIDGDGTWCHNPRKGTGTFSVVGNKDYEWLEFTSMLKSLNIDTFSLNRRSRLCGSTSSVYFSRHNSIKILGKYVYQNFDNDKIGLTRKYEKFQLISTKSRN